MEKKERKEETKKMNKKRFERFQFAVKQSTSIQRLQAVFLEGFLLPNVLSSSLREEKIEFFELPSEIIDPRTGDRLKASEGVVFVFGVDWGGGRDDDDDYE